MIEIEIDGKKLEAEPGSMVIEAADEAGIPIPRFCYHKKLSVAANCRMCLVEVGGARKPMPACATPVSEGMQVFTQSETARNAQKAVMEFLLINHPLDCPICDQGGQCELQDVAMGYGTDVSRFTERKRAVKDKNIGSLISTDMTRCIHCTRCIRVGDEIAGVQEMGATGRGEHMEVGTYVAKALTSELSGNMIDVCPVGALTSKPFRYSARAWELSAQASVSAHDAVGSNIWVHAKSNTVKRVVPKDNEAINEVWLSDRDRFAYLGVNHPDRLSRPKIRRGDVFETVSWVDALEYIKEKVQAAQNGGEPSIGAWVSPNSTTEEAFLMQQFIRGLGSDSVDYRIHARDLADQSVQTVPVTSVTLEKIGEMKSLWIVGSLLRKEQPLLNHRVRSASLNGAQTFAIAPYAYQNNFEWTGATANEDDWARILLSFANASLDGASALNLNQLNAFKAAIRQVDALPEVDMTWLESLKAASQSAIVMGDWVNAHPAASFLRAAVKIIALATNSEIITLSPGSNAAGCHEAGAVPHCGAKGTNIETAGLSYVEMLSTPPKVMFTMGIEPRLDCADAGQAVAALKASDCVVMLSAFQTAEMAEFADVLLPVAPYTENTGHLVNFSGTVQTVQAAVQPLGEARPAWKVLRVLGNTFELNHFDYMTVESVYEAFEKHASDNGGTQAVAEKPMNFPVSPFTQSEGLHLMTQMAPYGIDSIVRRSDALANTPDGLKSAGLQLNEKMLAAYQLAPGHVVSLSTDSGQRIDTIMVTVNSELPDNVCLLQQGILANGIVPEGYQGCQIEPINGATS